MDGLRILGIVPFQSVNDLPTEKDGWTDSPEGVPSVKHHWTVEGIEAADRDGLIAWARDICTGLDIDSAAEAINVVPTADAVVGALTDSLPEEIRQEVANICFEALGTKARASESRERKRD